jgi:heme A synthase
MLFVQVILGGSATILGYPPIIPYHVVWGTLTLIVLIVTTILARRDLGTTSTLFKAALAAIVDFVLQVVLGVFSIGSGVAIVIHLTNAFALAVIVTYLISFADNADKVTTVSTQTKMTTGTVPA